MRKMLTLLILFLFMLGLFASYLYLTEKTTAGSLKIAAGEEQIRQGEEMLAKGKTRLSNGQQQLSVAKKSYNSIKTISYLSVVAIPFAGGIIAVTNSKILGKKISEGSQLVANGKSKIKAGEDQLNAGKEALSLGKERLKLADKIRIASGIGAIFCAALFVVLGFCWRRKR